MGESGSDAKVIPPNSKGLLVFEKAISKANIKKLEDAGYTVICTSVRFTSTGTYAEKIAARMALKFIGDLPIDSQNKREFGCRLVNDLAKKLA